MATFEWPPHGGSGGGVPIYPSFALLPASATQGDLAVAADTGILYEWTGSAWVAIGSPGVMAGIGPIDSQSPSANGAVDTNNTIVLQSASVTVPGLVNNTTQSFSGNKTFTGTISASNLSGTNTGDVTLTAVGAVPQANGASLSGQVLTLQPANTSFPGVLLAADWNTFNSKQSAGAYITALTGDGTAAGPGSSVLTLTTVNANVGSFGSASAVSTFTVNAKGLLTAAGSTAIQIAESQVTNLVSDLAGKQPVGNYITALTGDATAAGPGSAALTLATVNANVGSFAIATITVNAKGLITAASAASTTGSGAVVLATSPTLVTPALGTPSAAVLTNATGLPLTSGTTGVLPETKGGTNQSTYATGDTLYASAANTLSKLPIGSTGDVLTVTGGVPAWAPSSFAPSAPTVQTFLLPSYLTITVTAANATTGAVYQDGFGLNFTVLYTIVSGTTLVVSFPANSPTITGTTLTLMSGTGDATITLSSYSSSGLYQSPSPSPLYLKVRMVGGGGGGGGASTNGADGGLGASGGTTVFGTALLTATGGVGGSGAGVQDGGAGGTATVQAPAIQLSALSGGVGGGALAILSTSQQGPGGNGASSPFGGAGAGSSSIGGYSAVTNTGSGGGGASGGGPTTTYTGSGGGAGGYLEAYVTPGTYSFNLGSGGAGGAPGTNSSVFGGNGALGVIIVEEYYS